MGRQAADTETLGNLLRMSSSFFSILHIDSSLYDERKKESKYSREEDLQIF